MLPEEHKLRTVQVRETATNTLVTAIALLSPGTPRVHSPQDCGKIAFETPIRHTGHLGTAACEQQADVAALAHG
jgi:hypothetical protein